MSVFARQLSAKKDCALSDTTMITEEAAALPAVDPIDDTPDEGVFVPSQPEAEPAFSEEEGEMRGDKSETEESEATKDEEPVVTDSEVVVDDDAGEVEIEDDDEDDDLVDDVESDALEIDQLSDRMTQISEAYVAVETYGSNPSAIGVLKATRLLTGTALESIGLESFTVSKPGDPESNMALEALGDSLKETAARWSAKILGVIKKIGGSLLSSISAIWDKITSSSKKIGGSVKETAVAHPYTTAVAVIGAIGAVAAIVAYASGNLPLPGAKSEMVKSFNEHLKNLIEKIKWPFGKIEVSEVGGRLKVAVDAVKGAASAGATKALGWTSHSVAAIVQHLGRAWDQIKLALTALGHRVMKVAETDTFKKIGAGVNPFRHLDNAMNKSSMVDAAVPFGLYFATMFAWILTIQILVIRIVNAGFKLIDSTFHKLSGGQKEATA